MAVKIKLKSCSFPSRKKRKKNKYKNKWTMKLKCLPGNARFGAVLRRDSTVYGKGESSAVLKINGQIRFTFL